MKCIFVKEVKKKAISQELALLPVLTPFLTLYFGLGSVFMFQLCLFHYIFYYWFYTYAINQSMYFYKYFQPFSIIILHQQISVNPVSIISLSKQECHQYTNNFKKCR